MSDNEILELCTGFIDTVNDPVIGNFVTGGHTLVGMLGKKVTLSDEQVRYKNNVVYGGSFQYVQYVAGQSYTAAYGQIAFWSNPLTFFVTADPPSLPGQVAGVFLGAPTTGRPRIRLRVLRIRSWSR